MNEPRDGRFSYEHRLVIPLLLFALLGSCSDDPTADSTWGTAAVDYFDALAAALTADDTYDVLDFYAPEAVVQNRTSDFQDAWIPVPEYLASHRADLRQDILSVHLGRTGAVTLIDWPGSGRLGAAILELDGGSIIRETDFVDVDSLRRGLLASPDVAEVYEAIYRDYAEVWSSGDSAAARRLYDARAAIEDSISDVEARGHAMIEQLVEREPRQLSTIEVAALIGTDSTSNPGPALYLDPSSFGRDPGRAIAVYGVETGGCSVQLAVLWQVADGRITAEERYSEVESYGTCSPKDLPQGWWTGLALPGPRDEIVTGTIETETGTISVHNGTGRLETLVRWGLDRFGSAGLAAPSFDSATFEPTRHCEGVGGRLITEETSRDLVLCVDERDLCAGADDCDTPLLAIRVAMLHEIGHAWLADHVGENTRRMLMELSGRTEWSSQSVAWADRGVEYAAEVLAWGLVGEPIDLAQLGNPPCEQLHSAFEILTGRPAGPGSLACAAAD